ncbi:GDSL-type esterase/lipase family protein [Sphingomonas nostoxanthinifaciens]|uniref:GDSL-type esterase/lipase family protein n=1 Tax=Sphingomonas nostoxanthinifaciens TaxID=2872652 RepID=UPI001CC1E6AB|nr:GDSL-type esterase/lipase family protein [Sphingomonas nostoxanthinifaciens]UAK23922.1 SGNH/GDSL hydrolase family protein [Sphingomonas nostoxanthinifaciens]
MISLLAAAVLSFGGTCTDSLCNPRSLDPFFAKLARQGPGVGGRPVHILQIGDSHTAGDSISGAWRDLLQRRYGAGGRGVLPPGRPYDGYVTHGSTEAMSSGWSIAADFGKAWTSPSPPLGLSAFSATSIQDGATMSISADPGEMFDRFTVCAIAKPGAGSLQLRAGTDTVIFSLGSVTERPQCRTMHLTQPASSADVTTSDGPVTITSWATFRDTGGVALSNLGVVGSQLMHFSRTDDAVLSEELHAYQPDLIVIAFGTNEGFGPRFSAFEYETILRTQIGRIRRLAGNVPILLLGAPDALSRRAEMRSNGLGDVSADCPPLGASPTPSAPAAAPPQGVIAGIMDRLRASIGMTGDDATPAPAAQPPLVVPPPVAAAPTTSPPVVRPGLFPPAALKAVRDVQRRVAGQLNVAFWDWEARMGGRCAANDWVHRTPALMRGDYVHYTTTGGQEIAQRLQADLDRAAAR